ncbi:MAG: hypothetical protein HFH93_14325 [Lachnospiraceae bacterium]|nr:hypothetical protein [Lachnospiraceae bacterium]
MHSIRVESPGNKPYLISGHKLYMIGSQDGLFPERGEHLPYKMWGVWAPPVKVLGGFWLKVDGELVRDAVGYEQLPYGAVHFFEKEAQWKLERFQYVPQEEKGLVLEVTLENLAGEKKERRLTLGLESDLMPVWLAERAGIVDGADEGSFDSRTEILRFLDTRNGWTALARASEPAEWSEDPRIPVERKENPNSCYREISCRLALMPGERRKVRFCIAFSEHSQESAQETLAVLEAENEALLERKKEVYARIDDRAVLNLPGRRILQEMYDWTKYINDWIIRDVEGVGCGVAAGYAEFPWWFGNDTNYIVPALLMQGEYEVCKSTLRLLKEKSMECNGNGRVVHEISTNGKVYYEGMSTETPQFADTVWMVYQWSGDYAFLEEMYDFCAAGMEWIDSICEDGLPTGYGISEIAGLDCFCCDTALLAIRGYEILSLMSGALGKREAEAMYGEKRLKTWELFQKEFYLPEYGLYGDMAAYKEDIIPRAETWKYTLRSFPITEEEKIMGESSCRKDKSPEDAAGKERLRKRMESVLQEALRMEDGSRKAFYLFGAGHSFVPVELGYLRGREAEALLAAREADRARGESVTGDMMPIGLGREIMGLGNIGKLDLVLEDMEKVAEGFGKVMPGATNEIYPEKGCFVQAWNSLATMWPYAGSLFGIRPDAHRKHVLLAPCLGEQMDGLSLTNLPIGGEAFDFYYERNDDKDVIRVRKPSPEWTVSLGETENNIELIAEDR